MDRDAYVVCVLEQLHRALNNRDVFASPSHRWSNPRARLLDGPDWDAVEEDVLAGLSLDVPVEEHLAELVRGLDSGWKRLAERLDRLPGRLRAPRGWHHPDEGPVQLGGRAAGVRGVRHRPGPGGEPRP
ncbi:hypothetical protein U9R90_19115 [Streptomyces sp. E11-3]